MKTRVHPCCGKQTFATEKEARRRLDRMTQLGLRSVLPTDVEQCRNGWHLKFPTPNSGPSAKLRALVEARDKGCVRCGAVVPRDEDSVHHRIPRGRGGENTAENLLLLCGSGTTGCHGYVESHRTEAYNHGYLVKTGYDPLDVPVLLLGKAWAYPSPGGKWVVSDGSPSDLLIPEETS
jgi:HNH endonuclease